MDPGTERVLTATIPAAVAFIGSLIVVWRANSSHRQDFYSHGWWERKAQVYDNIIGAFGIISHVLGELEDHYRDVRSMNDDYLMELGRQKSEAITTLKRLSVSGDFLITTHASVALQKAASTLDFYSGMSPADEIEKDQKAVAKALDIIKREGLRDLNVAKQRTLGLRAFFPKRNSSQN